LLLWFSTDIEDDVFHEGCEYGWKIPYNEDSQGLISPLMTVKVGVWSQDKLYFVDNILIIPINKVNRLDMPVFAKIVAFFTLYSLTLQKTADAVKLSGLSCDCS